MATFEKPRVRGARKGEPIRDLQIGRERTASAETFELRFRVAGKSEDWQAMPVGALLLTRTEAQRVVDTLTRLLGKGESAGIEPGYAERGFRALEQQKKDVR